MKTQNEVRSQGDERVKAPVQRNTSMDAYRGFVMLLILTEVLQFDRISKAFPGSVVWRFLAYHTDHVAWVGCSLHDLIQPSFSFLVGVALPYSIASRLSKGGSFPRMFAHAFWRSTLLVLLGIFLRSQASPCTNFTFEDTLTQIGLGYPALFLLGFARPRWQWISLGTILFGYWLAWALYPVPGPGTDLQTLGVPPGWQHNFSGFLAHWNINTNLGAAFDRWFLNLFHRPTPFVGNGDGYLTLSFIPTLGTMILGLITGRWLRTEAPSIPFKRFGIAAAACIVSGLLLHGLGICPIVKKIWTPSWTLFSGGLCFLLLMAFSWIMQVKGWRAWAFPLVVVGVNSIAAYLIIEMTLDYIAGSFVIHLGPTGVLRIFGDRLEPFVIGALTMIAVWLILFWMYRRKLFLKI